ncbi:MAG TPA: ABC transporter substrate-binding protein [Myxococcaceae bacterium]|nr:ABC transporter substrate-binding protein [Myxococcaceae bacterium]
MSPARALAALSLLLLVTGCPRKQEAPPAAAMDAGPAQRAEIEPDDRPEQSMALGENTDVAASLSSTPAKPDEDWYLLFGDRPRAVDVTVSGIPGTVVLLEAYDETRTRLAAVSAEAEGQPARFPNLTVRGKLLLRVSAARKGGGGAYTLSVRYGEPKPGTEVEPNDRHADATEIQPQGDVWTIQGLYGSPGDEDHFRIVLEASADAGVAGTAADGGGPATTAAPPGTGAPPAASPPEPPRPSEPAREEGFPNQPPPLGGVRAEVDAGVVVQEPPRIALRIEISGVPGVRPEVQLLSEAEATLFTARGTEGQPLSQRNVAVRVTDRVIDLVVKSAWTGTGKDARRAYDPEHPYTLTVSREAAGANAEYEPNDDLAHATPLPLDGYREGFLTPKTDVDYYVVRPAQPSLVRFELSGVEKLDLQLSVVEPGAKPGTEKVLQRSNDGAVKEPERLNSVACDKECFVKVEGALRKVDGKWVREFENPDQPYRLTARAIPDDGSEEREPNDSADQATALTLGKPIRGTVYPKKDVDYFRLDLSDRPVKTALKATLTGILKVDVALFLYQRNDDGSLSLVQTSDRGKGDAPEIIRYAADPGVYLFKVQDSKNRESNFQDSYQLTVEEDAP